MRRRMLLAGLLIPLVFASGCISVFVEMFTDPMGRKASLRKTQREYTNAVRWGEVEKAASFVDPEVRQRFLDFEDEFEGIRITDFEVGEIEFDEPEENATVRVTYFAYSMSTMLESEIKETQSWQRPHKGNQWFVKPEIEGLVDQVAEAR